MFCAKCGRELRDDDRFCPSCGEPVREIPGSSGNSQVNSSKISKEHIYFDWDNLDLPGTKSNPEKQNVVFDWGRNDSAPKKVNDSDLFKDKSLVQRETQTLEMGDAKMRAGNLREEYQVEKENVENNGNNFTGIYNIVSDLQNEKKKTIFELEEELFSNFDDVNPKEKSEEQREVSNGKEGKTVVDKLKDTLPRGAFASILAKISKEEVKEEPKEENNSFDVKEESSAVIPTSFADIIKNIKKNEEDVNKVSEVKEEPKEEKSLSEPMNQYSTKEEKNEAKLEEEFFPKEKVKEPKISGAELFKQIKDSKELSDKDRENIDSFLEQTIIYNKKDIDKAIEKEEPSNFVNDSDFLELENIDSEANEDTTEKILENKVAEIEISNAVSNALDEVISNQTEETEEIKEAVEASINEVVENIKDTEIKDESPELTEEIIEEASEEVVETSEVSETPTEETKDLLADISVDTTDLPERLDEKFLTFARKNEEFEDLLNKEKERIEAENNVELSSKEEETTVVTEEVTVEEAEETEEISTTPIHEELDPEVFPETPKATEKDEEGFTQSVEILTDIANSLNNKKEEEVFEDTETTEASETPVPRVTRMTLTGLDLDKTFDFDDTHKLKEVQTDVLNDVFDLSNIESLKSDLDEFYSDDDVSKKKKHVIVKIIIGFLIALILFELVIVVSKFLIPDSRFSLIVSGMFDKAIDFIKMIFKRG